jgi:hypothetical protein
MSGSRAANAALDFTETLPSYVCQEMMSRFQSESHPVSWHAIDVVSMNLVYDKGKEDYRDLAVNGKPVKELFVYDPAKAKKLLAEAGLGSPAALQQLAAAKSFRLGYVDLNHVLDNPNRDTAHFIFFNTTLNVAPLFAATIDSPPLGTCIAQPTTSGGFPFAPVSPLDAGSAFTIKGPAGTMNVTANNGDRITLSSTGAFLTPGDYTMSGPGGKDVGPFQATIRMSQPLVVTSKITTPIARSQSLTISWSGGGTDVVEISGSSAVAAACAPGDRPVTIRTA